MVAEEIVPIEVVASAEDESPTDSLSPTAVSTEVRLDPAESISTDVASALRRSPGLALRRTGAPGSSLEVSIRGSAADQVVVTLGGLPLTPPGGGPVDLSAIPPSLLDRMTITRGTEGASYGAGALGGVLHLEPLSAAASSIRAASGKARGRGCCKDAAAAGSSYTLSLRADSLASTGSALTWRGREGETSLAAALDLHASAGRFSFDRNLTPNLPGSRPISESRENNGAVQGSGLLSMATPAGSGRLRLTAFGHQARREVAGMVGFPTPGAGSDVSRMLLGGSFESRPSGLNAGQWSAAAWVSRDRYDYDPGPAPAPSAGIGFQSARQIAGLRASLGLLAAGTALRISSEATMETLAGTGVDAGRAAGSVSLSDTAFLLRDALELQGALRLDLFSGHEPTLSPKLGARLSLPGSVILLANVGRAVRMPALFELFGQTALIASNEELEPEAALTADAGLEISGGSVRSRLVLWHSHYDDLIAYELYPPLRLRPFNVGRAITRGLEMESGVAPLSCLELSLAYTFTDTVNLSESPVTQEKMLPYRPRHRGLAELRFDYGPVRLHAAVEAQSTYPRNRANTKWIPPRVLVEGGVGLRVGPNLMSRILVTNLLNDRGLEDLFGYPLPGRAAFLLLGYDR